MKRWKLFPALAVVTVAASAVVATAGFSSPGAKVGSSAKPITVLSLWGGSEKNAFVKVLAGFTKKTGLKVQYETARDFVPVIRTRLAAGNPPMIAIVPRPGVLGDLAREGSVKDLGTLGLSTSYLKENYGPAWIDLGTVNGKIYGVAAKANSKSVVWYRPDQFKKFGLKVPATWAQLLAVTKTLKAKSGGNPWSLGAKDSWTLTDWFENIYVRQAGPDKYTRLFSGKLAFDDASVAAALRTMTQILNNQYVAGGIQAALGTAFVDGIAKVFGTNPDAQLYMEGGFVGGIALGDVNPKLKAGVTIQEAPFPTINPAYGSPIVGGGDLAAAFVDNDGVRKLLKYLSSAEAGKIWVSTGAIVSPNKKVPATAYPNVLVRAEAKQVASAKVFRFDGSDLMPGTLGNDWGAMLQNVIQKPGNIGKLLSDFQKKAKAQFPK